MSFATTVALGALAGLTIFLGLPIARLGRPGPRRMSFLNAASVGVLLFILYDVLQKASGTVDDAMDKQGHLRGAAYAGLLLAGLTVGSLGLIVFERFTLRRQRRPLPSGPGAMAAAADASGQSAALAPPYRIALFIATGIGLHNFSEGLAIGGSAANNAYRLFGLLVIGFALHNITEGFGITAPLINQRPSWGFLAVCGLIGGGPTFVGTIIGYGFHSAAVSVLFLALAAGAIIYVIGELQHAGRKIGAHDIAMVGLVSGFTAGYTTDLILHIAGS